MSYRKIFLTVNPESGTLINPADGSSASMPSLYYGETAVLCISFLDGGLNIYPLAGSDTFELAADNDFVHGSDPLMIYSGNDMVDIPGDWNNISRESGRISVRVNCMTDGFATKLGASESIYFNLELKRYIAGSSSPSIMLISKAKGKNVVHLSENEPVPSDVNYYNAAQTDALLRAGRELQFSSDFIHWHDTQLASDSLWRERYPGGEWSVAIALPAGAQGEKGDKGDKGDQGDSGTNAPDVQIQYSIDGSTNWHALVTSSDFYMRLSTDAGTTWGTALKYRGVNGLDSTPSGVVQQYIGTTAPSGWLLLQGGSIGDASSSATIRANSDTEALFTLLWNSISDTYAAVSSGRGASAAADFAAHKTITLPDLRGRTVIGSGTGSGLTSRTHGATGGAETHTLSIGEIPSHQHSLNTSYPFTAGGSSALLPYANSATVYNQSASGAQGGGGAHNNMQPFLALNYIIKL